MDGRAIASSDKDRPIVTVEYSVSLTTPDDDAEKHEADSTASATGSDLTGDKDGGQDASELSSTKSVNLSMEFRPDGRTYVTKR